MAVALVATSTSGATDAQTSSRTVPVPAGAAAGHVAEIAIELWLDTSTDPTITWPAGFTQVAYIESTTDGFTRLYVARKVLTGADTGNYSMSWTGSYWNQAQAALHSGVDNTTPLDVAAGTAVTGSTTAHAACAVTTAAAGCGMVFFEANENNATSLAPTGYTEQQEANYLKTNTKIAGAAGSESISGGSLSVSTVKVGVLLALRPAGGGASLTLGLVTENDTAFSLTRSKAGALGLALETDSSLPVSKSKSLAFGLTQESDTAHALSREKAGSLGLVAELESALTMSATKTATLGLPTELNTALAIDRVKDKAFGLPVEIDSGLPLVPAKSLVLGLALEFDTVFALNLSGGVQLVLGLANEADSVFPLGFSKTKVLGLIQETDSAFPLGGNKVLLLGQAAETDTAHALGMAKSLVLGLPTESDIALSLALSGGELTMKILRHGVLIDVPLSSLKVYRFGRLADVVDLGVTGHEG